MANNSNNKLNNIDTELLISEVEQRPNLWDVSHEDYKNRDNRLKSWENIASVLITTDFENLSEVDKKNICKYGAFLIAY